MKMNYFKILFIGLALISISCERFKEDASIESFKVRIVKDTVPAIIEIEHIIHVQNTCVDYTLEHIGADSIAYINSEVSKVEFREVLKDVQISNACVNGGSEEFKATVQLKYLKSGEYKIVMKLKGDKYEESFRVYNE